MEVRAEGGAGLGHAAGVEPRAAPVPALDLGLAAEEPIGVPDPESGNAVRVPESKVSGRVLDASAEPVQNPQEEAETGQGGEPVLGDGSTTAQVPADPV